MYKCVLYYHSENSLLLKGARESPKISQNDGDVTFSWKNEVDENWGMLVFFHCLAYKAGIAIL